MFENLGSKLKKLAVIQMILGIVASVIVGLFYISGGRVFAGLCIVIVGVIVSWLEILVKYAVGQLVDNSEMLLYSVRNQNSTQTNKNNIGAALARPTDHGTAGTPAQAAACDEWRCECGRMNKKYVYTCACGKNRM